MSAEQKPGAVLEVLRARLPEAARDLGLNLQTVLAPGAPLSEAQRWGVAVASAVAARQPELSRTVLAAARQALASAAEPVVDDALAAAALMAMNNVYYRFRHLVGHPAYAELPPRLRMNRIVKPRTSKADFELLCLAVSAINGCGTCLAAHERAVQEGGLTPAHVHEAVRVASAISGAAVAVELADLLAAEPPSAWI